MQFIFHTYLFLGWAVYCCLHSIFASIWCKQLVKRNAPFLYPYYRFMFSLFATITLAGILFYQYSHSSYLLFRPNWYLIVLALVASIAGLSVMVISGRKYLLMISGASVFKGEKVENKLEQEGLHSYVRHPVYSGTILTIWALFLIFPLFSNLIACGVITIYTLIGIGLEERKLILEFGEHYINYARKTPMLFPLIGKRTS